MDRGSLETLLEQGLSLAEIGRRFGCHESTVGYWVKKHGLQAAHREKHAARGAIPLFELGALVDEGLSIAEIAARVARSKGTVRHWLREHGLRTHAQEGRLSANSTRAAKAAGLATVMRRCSRHGTTEFWLEGRGYYRCKRCRMERVSRRRRALKQTLIAEAGGCCVVCGYDRCAAALHFHHLDPATKRFHLSMQGVTRSLARARAEMAKCVLLCANCHAEVEAGITDLPQPGLPSDLVA
jgi:transposase